MQEYDRVPATPAPLRWAGPLAGSLGKSRSSPVVHVRSIGTYSPLAHPAWVHCTRTWSLSTRHITGINSVYVRSTMT